MPKGKNIDPDTAHNIALGYLQDHDRAHSGRGSPDHGDYSILQWHRAKGWKTHSSGHPSLDIADTKARPLLKPHQDKDRPIEYGISSGPPGKDYDVKDSADRSLAAVRVMKTNKAKEFLSKMNENFPGIVKDK